jgi:hypothetical protein
MSIGSVLSGALNKVKSVVSSDEPKAVTPPPPPPAAPVVPAQHQTGFSGPTVGGRSTMGPVENAVAARADRNTPMNLNMTSQHERLNNLTRLTQVDGDMGSDGDLKTCGVQSVVAGLYLNNPTALPKVADYLLTKKGANLDDWSKAQGLDPKKARADLAALKAGTASPRQLATMSQLLMRDMKDRSDVLESQRSPLQRGLGVNASPVVTSAGVDAKALGLLTSDILTKEVGVAVPPMRLELRDIAGKGHWVAQYDVASMADIEENAKKDMVVTFDPWPANGGKATTGVAVSKAGADRLHPGTSVQEITVDGNGTTRDTTED